MSRFRTLFVLCGLTTLVMAGAAQADCVRKGAQATAGTESQAKWFALETMVQSVSWGLWPSFVANGSTPGYKITQQRYKCTKGGFGVTCRGSATFCKTS